MYLSHTGMPEIYIFVHPWAIGCAQEAEKSDQREAALRAKLC
jgi:hypothetical protein